MKIMQTVMISLASIATFLVATHHMEYMKMSADNAEASKKVSLDLSGMMDQTLDSIAEAPDFTTPPAGDYTLQVKSVEIEKYFAKKEPDVEVQRIRITYSILHTIALVDDTEQPVPDASMFSETFMGTEEGLGYFKKAGRAIMNVSTLDQVPLRDIISSIKAQIFDARISIRKTPKPGSKTEFFENVSIRVIPPAEEAVTQ